MGASNGSVIISVPAGGGGGDGYNIIAAGTQTANSAATIVFSDANGVSFGLDGSTVTASVAAAGGGITHNYYNPQDAYPIVGGNQGQATLHMQPFKAPNVTFDRIVLPMRVSNATNSSGSATVSAWVGFYTRTASSFSLLSSTSNSFAMTHSGTVGSYSQFGGIRLFTIPFSGSIPEEQYYCGIIWRTTTGGANCTIEQMLCSQLNSNFSGILGEASNATVQQTRGLGHYSASTTALPASVAISQIRGTVSNALRQPSIYLVNGTF